MPFDGLDDRNRHQGRSRVVEIHEASDGWGIGTNPVDVDQERTSNPWKTVFT